MDYETMVHFRSRMHGMEVWSWAGCTNYGGLGLLAKCDFTSGWMSLQIDILCLHEILFVVDVSWLNFLIERSRSVLAWNSGQRLGLITVGSPLSLWYTEFVSDLMSSSSGVWHTRVICDNLRLNRQSFYLFWWQNSGFWRLFLVWQKDLGLWRAHKVLKPSDRLRRILFLSVFPRFFVVDNTSEILWGRKLSLRRLDADLRLMVNAMSRSSHSLNVAMRLLVSEVSLRLLVGDVSVDLQEIGIFVHIGFLCL